MSRSSRSLTSGRGRRVRVMLASGLILGVGAAGTLAAWTGTVNVAGAFSASTFGIELNVDGNWSGDRKMTFNADQLYPGAVVYAPVLVRTTDASTLGAELTLSGNSSSGPLMNFLSYRVVSDLVPEQWLPAAEGSPPACNEDRFSGDPHFVLGSTGTAVPMTAPATVVSPQPISAAGANYAAYCFEVTLSNEAPSGVQGDEADHTWTWDAISVSTEAEP